ncbi:MAG: hypothetical protein LBH04_04740 [Tannerellaceae bacterium]|nr:hypothetical protein [Tannerellaceae bacterium]
MLQIYVFLPDRPTDLFPTIHALPRALSGVKIPPVEPKLIQENRNIPYIRPCADLCPFRTTSWILHAATHRACPTTCGGFPVTRGDTTNTNNIPQRENRKI